MSEEIVASENSMRMSSNTVPMVVPDDTDAQVSRIALAYNAKEVAAVQQLFGHLAVHQFGYVIKKTKTTQKIATSRISPSF